MRRFAPIFLFALVYSAAFAQQAGPNQPADPFSITTGKSFSASRSAGGSTARKTVDSREWVSRGFREALDLIRNNHAGVVPPDLNKLTKNAISTMLSTLDPHSSYFDPGEYSELLDDQRSEYFGIGASIANYSKDGEFDTYVTSTFPDSPASRKRLRFGDRIISVDNEDMKGRSAYYVRNKVRGRMGSAVRLKIQRPGVENHFMVVLRRNRVPQPSIADAYMLGGKVGYIDMTSGFNYTTEREMDVAIRELRSQGMQALVLDLRDNTGGILEQAVRVAEKFVPRGKQIVSQKGRFFVDNRRWNSKANTPLQLPLVILVNEETASASEIVAGALQDYDRALIVGTQTFGKGLVQSVIDLPDGAGLTLTTAKYYTPSGRLIQRDYSGSLYDYYRHREAPLQKTRVERRTLSGRAVFDGNGITPDEVVGTPVINKVQESLLDPVFHFTRKLANGDVAGFENHRVFGQIDSPRVILETDFEVGAGLLSEFKRYLAANKAFDVDPNVVDRQIGFLTERIRYHYVSAKYGNITARQVLLQYDPQLKAAISKLPKARQLARSTRLWNRGSAQ